MYKLSIGSINLPEIYVSQTDAEDKVAVENGFPFISWRGSEEKLIKVVMLPYLERMFPKIKWMKVLKLRPEDVKEQPVITVAGGEVECDGDPRTDQNNDNVTADSADGPRTFSGGNGKGINGMTVGDVIWGDGNKVNIEELQNLKLMPVFLDDVISSIKVNLQGMEWRGGYDKKLGACLGVYDQYSEPDNLIILDISASIPRGISDTMLALLSTFKEQLKADVIVTGSDSYYWAYGEELPDPTWIRRHIGCGNEETMFSEIMRKKISNRKFGHVVSFGDNDTPERWGTLKDGEVSRYHGLNIQVGDVWHFHTRHDDTDTGYAIWCNEYVTGAKHHNTKWCDFVERR